MSNKNYKVVPTKKEHIEDYGDGIIDKITETRYIIINEETGEILDDAQGYGYKTAKKAHAAWWYKHRDKEYIAKENKVYEYLKSNKKLCDDIFDEMWYCTKDNDDFNSKNVEAILVNYPDCNFSAKDIYKIVTSKRFKL